METNLQTIDTRAFRTLLGDMLDAYRKELQGGPASSYEALRPKLIAHIDQHTNARAKEARREARPPIEYRYTDGTHWCELGPAEHMKANFDGVYRLKAGEFPVWQGDAQRMGGGDAVAWHCVNTVTGKMLYTDSESEAVAMRDAKTKHWQVTPLVALVAQPVAEAAAHADTIYQVFYSDGNWGDTTKEYYDKAKPDERRIVQTVAEAAAQADGKWRMNESWNQYQERTAAPKAQQTLPDAAKSTCALAWDGKNVFGDKASIDAIKQAIHDAGTVPELKERIRSMQDSASADRGALPDDLQGTYTRPGSITVFRKDGRALCDVFAVDHYKGVKLAKQISDILNRAALRQPVALPESEAPK